MKKKRLDLIECDKIIIRNYQPDYRNFNGAVYWIKDEVVQGDYHFDQEL